ncbi:MAG TPA: S9 family peptidase [Pyrinomonadaceae bacterium]|nr:S9 family peptidase [Pyrinomonadaceae bacterium]HMP66786.1 S9 family peptidase [Pyrinomonadaceae bacterium]
MKKVIVVFFLSFFVITSAVVVSGQLPPLIDREIFFDNPEYAGAQISPDGKYISFIKPFEGTMNVWVKGIKEPFTAARPLTNDKRPVRGYFWSRDGKFILFVQDIGGDENFNVYAVDPAAKPAEGSPVPAARNITAGTKIRAFINHVPESDPDVIYVGINDRDPAWHDLYKIKISTGERTLINENRDRLQDRLFDNTDKLRLAVRSAQNGDTEILRVEEDGKTTKIYDCNAFETCSLIRFHKDNRRVYMQTNKGDVDLIGLVLMDVATGKIEKVESDPLGKADLSGVSISTVTKEIVATSYYDDRLRTYWKDKKFQADHDYIKKRLGDREIGFNSSTSDESKWIVSTFSDVDPGTVWLFDRRSRDLTTLYQIREKLDRKALAPMTSIRYKSSDGLEIQAYLTLPKGVPAKNLPLVVNPHGGPWARNVWGYNTYAQFLANRGYAVLQPNFRASTGFGKRFLNAGNNEWGEKMQDDITWGVKHLVDQGIVDAKRVGIMGGSYGGYAALAGVTFTPDVYAASVAIVPPSNLQTLLDSIPPYWEAIRETFYKRMGDPRTPEGLAQMQRQSPHSHADKIKTPLMVVQGANDPRVKQRESDQIVVALRDRNYPVEYILAPDEGHGFARPVNNMAMIAAAEKFLAKHLGGRYQESMTPEVAKRLKEITVDPKDVVIRDPNDPTGSGSGSAKLADLNGKWSMAVDTGGQIIDLAVEFKQNGSTFIGSMASSVGGGTIQDGKIAGEKVSGTLQADVQGSPTTIELIGTVNGDKMTGTLAVPGFGTLSFTAIRNK